MGEPLTNHRVLKPLWRYVVFDDTPDRSHDWLDDWKTRAAKQAAETQEMAEKLSKLSVSATNSAETVTVTLDSNGIVTGLSLDERVKSDSAEKIAEEILATMAKARNAIGKGASLIVKDSIGLESATGKAIMAGFRRRLRKEDLDASNRKDRP
jgi:DNA-binding protein YbaB